MVSCFGLRRNIGSTILSDRLQALADDVLAMRRDLAAIRALLESLVVQQLPGVEDGGLPADFPAARQLIAAGVTELDQVPRTAAALARLGIEPMDIAPILGYLSKEGANGEI